MQSRYHIVMKRATKVRIGDTILHEAMNNHSSVPDLHCGVVEHIRMWGTENTLTYRLRVGKELYYMDVPPDHPVHIVTTPE